jgi:hypothetical protein
VPFSNLPEYVDDPPRWVAVQYDKVNATQIQGILQSVQNYYAGGLWGNAFSINGSGRLVLDNGSVDFSSEHEDDSWVIALPMNPTAGNSPVFTHETLGQWQQRYSVTTSSQSRVWEGN